MKLVFLDIDGVLLSGNHMNALHAKGESGWKKFDPHCVRCFNELIAKTGAKIILSSTWRYHYETLVEMDRAMKERGVIGDVVGHTKRSYGPDSFTKNREDEVVEFLYNHTPVFGVQWLAIDDAPFLKIKRDHCVQTDFNVGFTNNRLAVAMSKWGRQELNQKFI